MTYLAIVCHLQLNSNIVLRVHTYEQGSPFLNQITDVVEFHPNVLDIGMAYMILCQSSSGIIVT